MSGTTKFLQILVLWLSENTNFGPPENQKKFVKGKLRNTDILAKEIVTLPMFPDMKDREVVFVLNTIKKFMIKNKI